MNMKTSIIICFKKFLTIKGRASRSEFWWFMLFNATIFFLLWFIDIQLLFNLAGIITLFPTACVFVRRFHDIDKSGWEFLLYYASIMGPILMFTVFIDVPMGLITPYLFIILFFCSTISLLRFLCRKGTEDENNFGADPLAK